jgi:hypothetical protein
MKYPDDCELFELEGALWLLTHPTNVAVYDFPFERYFECRHRWTQPEGVVAVSRTGAFDDYGAAYRDLSAEGIHLIHTPEQHDLCSELPLWYPLIEDLTARSMCFEQRPCSAEVSRHFKWPVFVKGVRQTRRHLKHLSIIESAEAFDHAMSLYAKDPVLHWQGVAVRELLPLRPVEAAGPEDRLPPVFEYRTFWWRGVHVGSGQYWCDNSSYAWDRGEEARALAIAGEVARRLAVPFLVVDIAQTIDGRWVVIEVNDGQESGYAAASPTAMWYAILEEERRTVINAAKEA